MHARTRLARITAQLQPDPPIGQEKAKNNSTASKESGPALRVVDERSGKEIRVPIEDNAVVRAMPFRQLKSSPGDFGLMVHDPAYTNTAVVKSRITEIKGEEGILRYRGYPIEQLAEKSNFLEVAYLIINGELPNREQSKRWNESIMRHTYIHEDLARTIRTFRYDAHPMGMLISCVSAMGTLHPEANPALQGIDIYKDERVRNKQIYRILGKLPTIAACCYRHRIGRPYNQPAYGKGYTENFLSMMDRLNETNYSVNPRLARALDVLFILHADHELNCSTAAMRHLASSGVDPYTAVAGAAGALYGPLHGGANEAVVRMLQDIGHVDNVPAFIADVKAKKVRLMGFGHRVYKNYDPRARIVRKVARDVFEIVGRDPLIDVATALEQTALSDEYFASRKLYPNVDFYSGIIYKAMGFPTDMFPVLFAIPRTVGWLAHWIEHLDDKEQKITRPRQVYTGPQVRDFVTLDDRSDAGRREQETRTLDAYSIGRRVVASDAVMPKK